MLIEYLINYRTVSSQTITEKNCDLYVLTERFENHVEWKWSDEYIVTIPVWVWIKSTLTNTSIKALVMGKHFYVKLWRMDWKDTHSIPKSGCL